MIAQGRAQRRPGLRAALGYAPPWVTRCPGLRDALGYGRRPALWASRVPRAALRSALGYHVNAPSGREENEAQVLNAL